MAPARRSLVRLSVSCWLNCWLLASCWLNCWLPAVCGSRDVPLARGLPDTLSVGRERSEALWEGYRSREGISAECRSGEGLSE